ncbi:MAG: magnesium/cobalt transporter CorA [Dehalococcoidia bacterium]
MTHTAIYRDDDGTMRVQVDDAALTEVHASGRGLLWVHITSADAVDAALLKRVFDVHALAIHDILNPEYESPKVDDYGDYLFIKLHGVDPVATDQVVATTELDLLVGRSWVVSAAHTPLPAIEEVRASIEANPRPMERGADMLAHVLIDALVDSILPTVHRMDDMADDVEARALDSPRRELLADILRVKRSAMHVYRVMVPQREVIYRLSRNEYPLISPDATMYYRDVYDHLVRLEDLVLNVRDLAEGALTTYLSAVNIRQNETMRVLAIVTSAFLPLTLLAGIYGMNFHYMPELDWPWAYPVVLAVMVVGSISVSAWLFGGWVLSRGRRAAGVTFRVEQRLLQEAIREASRLRDAVLGGFHD